MARPQPPGAPTPTPTPIPANQPSYVSPSAYLTTCLANAKNSGETSDTWTLGEIIAWGEEMRDACRDAELPTD